MKFLILQILFTTPAIADTYIEKSGKKKAQSLLYYLPKLNDHI